MRGRGTPRVGSSSGAPTAPGVVAGGKHPVSLLGEYCSKQKVGPPEYNLCFECGPDHKKNFLFKVCMRESVGVRNYDIGRLLFIAESGAALVQTLVQP